MEMQAGGTTVMEMQERRPPANAPRRNSDADSTVTASSSATKVEDLNATETAKVTGGLAEERSSSGDVGVQKMDAVQGS